MMSKTKGKGLFDPKKQKQILFKFFIFLCVKFYSNCYGIAKGQKRKETSHPEKCHSLCSFGNMFWKTFTNRFCF